MAPQSDVPRPPGIDSSFSATELDLSPAQPGIASGVLSAELERGAPPPDRRAAPARSWAGLGPLARDAVPALLRAPAALRWAVAGGSAALLITFGAWALRSPPAEASAETPDLGRWVDRLPEEGRPKVASALRRRDVLSALIATRTLAAGAKGPAVDLVRAHLALEAREPLEALTALERAVQSGEDVASDPLFVRTAVESFTAGQSPRTLALIGRVPRAEARSALEVGTTHWSFRIRHGSLEALKAIGADPPDAAAAMLLDVWQLERCDARRAVAVKLLARREEDERISPALEAASRRSADEGCLAPLLSPGKRGGR